MLPLLKWTGGKRKLVQTLLKYKPEKYNKYIEPFCGGAALFFHLEQTDSTINDSNKELINFYEQIVKNGIEILNRVRELPFTSDFYSEIRNWDRLDSWEQKEPLERAIRFLYLNKSGYSGMWRVNKNNQMNIPWGKYKSGAWPTENDIISAQNILKYTNISCKDFTKLNIQENDWVYIDPPYIPISTTSNYTSYTADGFNFKDQERLADWLWELDTNNIYFTLSNSGAAICEDLYDGFNIYDIKANRSINAGWSKENMTVNEIIVTNFK